MRIFALLVVMVLSACEVAPGDRTWVTSRQVVEVACVEMCAWLEVCRGYRDDPTCAERCEVTACAGGDCDQTPAGSDDEISECLSELTCSDEGFAAGCSDAFMP